MDDHSGPAGAKFMLWIDAVGGYWVCLGDQVLLGQPVRGVRVDVPILGDISSRHARICRDAEGYWIEPLREVRLDGRLLRVPAPLVDGSQIDLGSRVRLAFRRPHALSATARLDFISSHRTYPSADAIMLMAESCVLGPRPHSHVVCRHWTEELMLYRQEGALFCRAAGSFEVDGAACSGRGLLRPNSRITGEGFALSLEAITV
jgi:hypothetical protein